jgi:hypothetical protein
MESLGMTIATSVVAILTPFLKKGAEKFAEEIGKSIEESGGEAGKRVGNIIVDKTKKLFDKLKQKLSGNDEAEMNLRLFEKNPDNYSENFQKVLATELDKDKNFAQEVDGLVNKMKDASPQIVTIIENAKAKNITGTEIEDMKSGSSRTEIRGSVADESIVGTRAKRVG